MDDAPTPDKPQYSQEQLDWDARLRARKEVPDLDEALASGDLRAALAAVDQFERQNGLK
jgi:hypothetical protein